MTVKCYSKNAKEEMCILYNIDYTMKFYLDPTTNFGIAWLKIFIYLTFQKPPYMQSKIS